MRSTLRIVRGRFARRPATYPPLNWVLWTSVVLVLAVGCAAFLDTAAAEHARSWPRGLRAYASAFTVLGHGQWYLAPAIMWLLIANQIDWGGLSSHRLMAAYERTSLAFLVLAAIGLPGLAVNIVKILVGRARPRLYEELGAFSAHPFEMAHRYASFPSGHAATMGSLAAILVLLFPRWKYVSILACFAVAVTRIFVNAHYPSDVVTGFGFGFGAAWLIGLVFARLGFLFYPVSAGTPPLRSIFRSTSETESGYPAREVGRESQFST